MNVSVSWQTQSTSLFPSSPFFALFVLRKSEHMACHKDSMQRYFSLQNTVLIQAFVAGKHVTGKHSQIVLAIYLEEEDFGIRGKVENEILPAKS